MTKIVKNPPPKVKIIIGDAGKLEVESNSVDLIVTSPPYVNALDYYWAHMYNMLWLGIYFDLFRKHKIGAHSHFIIIVLDCCNEGKLKLLFVISERSLSGK